MNQVLVTKPRKLYRFTGCLHLLQQIQLTWSDFRTERCLTRNTFQTFHIQKWVTDYVYSSSTSSDFSNKHWVKCLTWVTVRKQKHVATAVKHTLTRSCFKLTTQTVCFWLCAISVLFWLRVCVCLCVCVCVFVCVCVCPCACKEAEKDLFAPHSSSTTSLAARPKLAGRGQAGQDAGHTQTHTHTHTHTHTDTHTHTHRHTQSYFHCRDRWTLSLCQHTNLEHDTGHWADLWPPGHTLDCG